MSFKLIPGAQHLWRAWSVQMAAIGVILPDLLQLIADNTGALPWFDASASNLLRLGCLLMIPVLRAVHQGDISSGAKT